MNQYNLAGRNKWVEKVREPLINQGYKNWPAGFARQNDVSLLFYLRRNT